MKILVKNGLPFYLHAMENTNSPWQILAAKEIYDNKWITLTHYDVINPAGGQGIYGKVHFKNYAIGILPLDEELNIYLVRQYRFTISRFSWELPEGGGPLDESPLESAKRELEEETGLHAKEWSELFHLHLSNSVSDEYGIVYLARGLSQHAAAPEPTEDIIVKKVSLDDALHMIDDHSITDSITIAALYKIKLMLLEGKI